MPDDPLTEKDGSVSESAGSAMRLICQALGLVLVLVGLGYGLSMLFRVLAVLEDPTVLSGMLTQISELIEAEKIALRVENKVDVRLGKAVAMVLVVMWYGLAIWIPILIMAAGAKLVGYNADDRLYIRNFLSQFLTQMKQERLQDESK